MSPTVFSHESIQANTPVPCWLIDNEHEHNGLEDTYEVSFASSSRFSSFSSPTGSNEGKDMIPAESKASGGLIGRRKTVRKLWTSVRRSLLPGSRTEGSADMAMEKPKTSLDNRVGSVIPFSSNASSSDTASTSPRTSSPLSGYELVTVPKLAPIAYKELATIGAMDRAPSLDIQTFPTQALPFRQHILRSSSLRRRAAPPPSLNLVEPTPRKVSPSAMTGTSLTMSVPATSSTGFGSPFDHPEAFKHPRSAPSIPEGVEPFSFQIATRPASSTGRASPGFPEYSSPTQTSLPTSSPSLLTVSSSLTTTISQASLSDSFVFVSPGNHSSPFIGRDRPVPRHLPRSISVSTFQLFNEATSLATPVTPNFSRPFTGGNVIADQFSPLPMSGSMSLKHQQQQQQHHQQQQQQKQRQQQIMQQNRPDPTPSFVTSPDLSTSSSTSPVYGSPCIPSLASAPNLSLSNNFIATPPLPSTPPDFPFYSPIQPEFTSTSNPTLNSTWNPPTGIGLGFELPINQAHEGEFRTNRARGQGHGKAFQDLPSKEEKSVCRPTTRTTRKMSIVEPGSILKTWV